MVFTYNGKILVQGNPWTRMKRTIPWLVPESFPEPYLRNVFV